MIAKSLLRASLLLLVASIPLHALAKTPKGTLAAPPADGPTQVEFSINPVSKWTDLPIGTYRVPNSDVIISGHQKNGAGMLFGVIGVAIQNSVQAHNGKESMASAEQALAISIDDEAKALLQAAATDPAYAGKFTTAATDGRKYEVTGAVVMSFASQQDVMPYVVLRVKLLDAGGSKRWTTRYIASSGARRPLVGEGSWTVDQGAVLRPQVSRLLKLAIDTMLTDIAHPYPRDEASMLTVRGYFPHLNKPLQVIGYKLAESDGRLLFLPKLGTSIVFAGVNVFDTSSMVVKAFAKGDKIKMLKPAEATDIPGHGATAATAAPAAGAPAGEATAADDASALPGATNGDDAETTEAGN